MRHLEFIMIKKFFNYFIFKSFLENKNKIIFDELNIKKSRFSVLPIQMTCYYLYTATLIIYIFLEKHYDKNENIFINTIMHKDHNLLD